MSVFLSAEWRKLCLVTYAVSPETLQPYLPKGARLDERDGAAFLSFVAFQFLDTRVRGLSIPFHVRFPEINLRFYVRLGEKRGVCFIREYVPKFCIALVANQLYNEPYLARPMRMAVEETADRVSAEYGLKIDGQWQTLRVSAANRPFMPPQDGVDHFFKEHEWGFGHSRSGETVVYRVEHPFWQVYPDPDCTLKVDFGRVYGDQWAFLNNQKPYHIAFAEGSPIKVMGLEKSV